MIVFIEDSPKSIPCRRICNVHHLLNSVVESFSSSIICRLCSSLTSNVCSSRNHYVVRKRSRLRYFLCLPSHSSISDAKFGRQFNGKPRSIVVVRSLSSLLTSQSSIRTWTFVCSLMKFWSSCSLTTFRSSVVGLHWVCKTSVVICSLMKLGRTLCKLWNHFLNRSMLLIVVQRKNKLRCYVFSSFLPDLVSCSSLNLHVNWKYMSTCHNAACFC